MILKDTETKKGERSLAHCNEEGRTIIRGNWRQSWDTWQCARGHTPHEFQKTGNEVAGRNGVQLKEHQGQTKDFGFWVRIEETCDAYLKTEGWIIRRLTILGRRGLIVSELSKRGRRTDSEAQEEMNLKITYSVRENEDEYNLSGNKLGRRDWLQCVQILWSSNSVYRKLTYRKKSREVCSDL